jgi:hypothetical protein
VAVEKVAFLEKLPKFGDGKCPGNPRESFVGHPNAIFILSIFAGVSFSTVTGCFNNYPF